MSDQIKPCPFCGFDGIRTRKGTIICPLEECPIFKIEFVETEWNMRVMPDQVRDLIDNIVTDELPDDVNGYISNVCEYYGE